MGFNLLIDKRPFHKRAIVGTTMVDIDLDVPANVSGAAEIVLEPQYAAAGGGPNGTSGGFTTVILEVSNAAAGGAGIKDFAILGKPHRNAGWHNLLSGLGEDGAFPILLRNASGSYNDAGGAGLLYVDCGPLYAVKFQAGSDGADVLTNGTFTGDATGWTAGTGIAYGTNNVAFTAASAVLKQLAADMATPWTAGVRYELTFTISGHSGGSLWAGTNTEPMPEDNEVTADGTYTRYVEADDHEDGLVLTADDLTAVIDSITLKPCADVQVMGNFFR